MRSSLAVAIRPQLAPLRLAPHPCRHGFQPPPDPQARRRRRGVESANLPNGVTIDLAIIRHPGASAVVALDADGAIAMLTQYRHAIGGWLREIPAGCRNLPETPRQCAERELREEAGLAATRWDHLGSIVTIPSFCDERIELFLARGLSPTARQLDHDEVIHVERVKFDDALAMVRRGEIIDAKTIVALYHTGALLHGESR